MLHEFCGFQTHSDRCRFRTKIVPVGAGTVWKGAWSVWVWVQTFAAWGRSGQKLQPVQDSSAPIILSYNGKKCRLGCVISVYYFCSKNNRNYLKEFHLTNIFDDRQKAGLWSRSPSNFGWLEPEPKPKNFRWWNRSLKLGFPFNSHSLWGKRVFQIIQRFLVFIGPNRSGAGAKAS